MFEIYAVDVFRTRRKCPHIMRFVDIPEEFRTVSKTDPDDIYIPKFLVVNFMLPAYAPSLWGAAEYDGESYSVVLYLIISPEAREAIKAGTTNASTLLRVIILRLSFYAYVDRFFCGPAMVPDGYGEPRRLCFARPSQGYPYPLQSRKD